MSVPEGSGGVPDVPSHVLVPPIPGVARLVRVFNTPYLLPEPVYAEVVPRPPRDTERRNAARSAFLRALLPNAELPK